jgi:hypothetical protein
MTLSHIDTEDLHASLTEVSIWLTNPFRADMAYQDRSNSSMEMQSR